MVRLLLPHVSEDAHVTGRDRIVFRQMFFTRGELVPKSVLPRVLNCHTKLCLQSRGTVVEFGNILMYPVWLTDDVGGRKGR